MTIDTIIVTSKDDSFFNVFLLENCWYPLRMDDLKIPIIKWIAVCQPAPIRALTHIARIQTIKKYKDTGRYILHFDEPTELEVPLSIKKGPQYTIQGHRYTSMEKILKAKSIEDLKPW